MLQHTVSLYDLYTHNQIYEDVIMYVVKKAADIACYIYCAQGIRNVAVISYACPVIPV